MSAFAAFLAERPDLLWSLIALGSLWLLVCVAASVALMCQEPTRCCPVGGCTCSLDAVLGGER